MANDRQDRVCVVPDAIHPGMWRVLWPDGHLSDMVNKTRAKQLAMAVNKNIQDAAR